MSIELVSSDSIDLLSRREEIRQLQIRCHLETSGYDPVSLAHQISDLKVDFPALYDDQLFAQHTVIVAISHSLSLNESVENSRNSSSNSSSIEGKIVGCIGFTTDVDDEDDDTATASLSFLVVDSTYRRQGIAAKLLDKAIESCQAKGYYQRIRLITLRGLMHAACRLYESRGFMLYKQRNGASQALDLFHVLFYEKDLANVMSPEDGKESRVVACDVDNHYPENIDDICHCAPCTRIRECSVSSISWSDREDSIERGVMS